MVCLPFDLLLGNGLGDCLFWVCFDYVGFAFLVCTGGFDFVFWVVVLTSLFCSGDMVFVLCVLWVALVGLVLDWLLVRLW